MPRLAGFQGPNAVLQRHLEQHAALTALNPNGVVPVRFLTVHDGAANRVIASLHRIGVGDQGIVASDTAIRLIVDLNRGVHARGCDAHWRIHTSHPETGMVFAGHAVPQLQRAAKLCRSLHGALPHLGLIAWDIGIDVTGQPWVLEFNSVHPVIPYIEALRGPALTAERWELLRHTTN